MARAIEFAIPAAAAFETGPVAAGEGLEEYARACDDEDFFDEHELKIQDKQGKTRALWPVKPGQRKIDAVYERQMRTRGYVRMLIAKARRVGSTTRVARHGYRYIVKNGGTMTVIAHRDRSTKNIFRMVRRFWTHQTPELRLPKGETDRRQEFTLQGNDGQERLFSCTTAGDADALRSEANNVLVLSEVPFYADADTLAPAALNTVNPGTGVVILEGTANGASGWWFDFVQASLLPDGQDEANDYEVVFISWMDDPDCVKAATEGEQEAWQRWHDAIDAADPEQRRSSARALRMAPEDEDTVLSSGMSLEQFLWWASKLTDGSCKKEGMAPRDVRRQEFPCTLEESFLTTGRQVFPTELLLKEETLARPFLSSIVLYAARALDRDKGWPDGYEVVADAYGAMQILDRPRPGLAYVAGVDPEEGKDNDSTGFVVFVREPFVQVARWAGGSIDPTLLAEVVSAVGWWYNEAFVNVEANGAGVACVAWMRRACGYRRLFRMRRYDQATMQTGFQFGWRTGPDTKPTMIGEVQRLLREERLHVRLPETFRQLKRYQRLLSGRTEAPRGDRDDDVSAVALAAVARSPEDFRGEPETEQAPGGFTDTLSTAYMDEYFRKRTAQIQFGAQDTIFGRIR